jgi:hypothetical protein
MNKHHKHTIRAIYDDHTIRVYQAYSPRIAMPALDAGRFVPPFRMERMTWIKPSFNWMMYRCGFAKKEGQERVLAIDITREGFEWALTNSAASRFLPEVHASYEAWKEEVVAKPVRVQWDPERNWKLGLIPGMRSIQIGLSGQAVHHYVNDWIVRIEDATETAHAAATAATPDALPCVLERLYPLPERLVQVCYE